MLTAFVFCGRGSLAAQHVGALQALSDRGIIPDLLVGSSTGAANAAFVAGYGAGPAALRRLGRVWASLGQRELFPSVRRWPRAVGRGIAGPRTPVPLRRLLGSHLPYVRVEDARIPLHLLACDAHTGSEVLLSDGLAVTAVMASCSVPGVFPPVVRRGRALCDGPFGPHSGIARASALGADRIFVLPVVRRSDRELGPSPWPPGRSAVYLAPAVHQRGIDPWDFRHAPTLIRVARERTSAWLDAVGLLAGTPGSTDLSGARASTERDALRAG